MRKPTRYLVAVLAISCSAAIVILAVRGSGGPATSSLQPDSIECLPAPEIRYGFHAPVYPALDFGVRPIEAEIDYYRRFLASPLDAATKGVALCSPAFCPPKEKAIYIASTSSYLNARQNVVRRLLRAKGEYGLQIAYDVSSTLQDDAIVDNLKELHQRKAIRLEDFGVLKYAAAILATKPATAFRPCDTAP